MECHSGIIEDHLREHKAGAARAHRRDPNLFQLGWCATSGRRARTSAL